MTRRRRTTIGDVDAATSLVQLMTYVPCARSGVVRFASKLSDRLFGPALATAVAAGQPGRDREKKNGGRRRRELIRDRRGA